MTTVLQRTMASRLRTEGDCSICLNTKVSDVAAISCCKHTFHTHCIQSWSQITNKCPLCKLCFKYITCLQTHQLIHVEHREQKLQRDDLTLDAIQRDDYWDCVPCQECKSTDRSNDHLAIICDSCENVYHTFCIGLGYDVPEEDHWFCPKCRAFLFPSTEATKPKEESIFYDDLSDFDINEELPENAFTKHSVNEADDEWLPRGQCASNNDTNHDFGTMQRNKKRKKRKQRKERIYEEDCVMEQEPPSSVDSSDTVVSVCEEQIKGMRDRKRRDRTNNNNYDIVNEAPMKRRKIGYEQEIREKVEDVSVSNEAHNDPMDARFYGNTMEREGVECVADRKGNKMWRFTFTKKKKKSK